MTQKSGEQISNQIYNQIGIPANKNMRDLLLNQ